MVREKCRLVKEREREKDREREREKERESERERARERKRKRERERSCLVKIRNIKKQNILYGCFKNNPHKR